MTANKRFYETEKATFWYHGGLDSILFIQCGSVEISFGMTENQFSKFVEFIKSIKHKSHCTYENFNFMADFDDDKYFLHIENCDSERNRELGKPGWSRIIVPLTSKDLETLSTIKPFELQEDTKDE